MCTHIKQACVGWFISASTYYMGLEDFRVCGEIEVGVPEVLEVHT